MSMIRTTALTLDRALHALWKDRKKKEQRYMKDRNKHMTPDQRIERGRRLEEARTPKRKVYNPATGQKE